MIRRHLRSTLFPYTTLFRSFLFLLLRGLSPGSVKSWPRVSVEWCHRTFSLPMFSPIGLAVSLFAASSGRAFIARSEEHTSELQSRPHLVCRLLLEKKK